MITILQDLNVIAILRGFNMIAILLGFNVITILQTFQVYQNIPSIISGPHVVVGKAQM